VTTDREDRGVTASNIRSDGALVTLRWEHLFTHGRMGRCGSHRKDQYPARSRAVTPLLAWRLPERKAVDQRRQLKDTLHLLGSRDKRELGSLVLAKPLGEQDQV
jgi:hypothetical protein